MLPFILSFTEHHSQGDPGTVEKPTVAKHSAELMDGISRSTKEHNDEGEFADSAISSVPFDGPSACRSKLAD